MCSICAQLNPFASDCAYDLQSASDVTASTSVGVYTNDQIARQLSQGYWGGTERAFDIDPGGTIYVDYSGLTSDGKFFAQQALKTWTAFTGIEFSTAARPGGLKAQVTFDDEGKGAFTTSLIYEGNIRSSRVNIDKTWNIGDEGRLDSYVYQTYLHEIGHVLGLGHAGNYNGNAVWGQDNDYLNDSWQASVMSYFSQTKNTYIDASYAYAITPMIADILAIHNLYGSVGGLRADDTVYGRNSTAGGIYDVAFKLHDPVTFTILDDGGNDLLDLSLYTENSVVNLAAESISSFGGLTGNLSIARGTVIEAVRTGAGRDTINGNDADNVLDGGLGNDTIDGGAGRDTVRYDTATFGVTVNLGSDSASGGQGYDRLFSIENVVGSRFNDNLSGDALGNDLDGAGGNDRLRGYGGNDSIHGGDGRDTASGGLGDDELDGGFSDDQLRGEGGNDTLIGGDGADWLEGGTDRDLLLGGDGADRLIGGSGQDTLSGGSGNDMLTGQGDNDVFLFARGCGIDSITDFRNGSDRIDLTAFGFSGFEKILAKAIETADGLLLMLSDTDRVSIDDMTLAKLDVADFFLFA